jgi:hypothetical protein
MAALVCSAIRKLREMERPGFDNGDADFGRFEQVFDFLHEVIHGN